MRLLTCVLVLSMAASAAHAAGKAREVRPVARAEAGSGPISAPPGSTVEQYTLNAQYRGTVKKGFSDIGRGFAVFSPQQSGRFTVKMEGTVHDPESQEAYGLWIDMDFESNGKDVREVANRSHYTANVGDYRPRVEKVIPFVYLVKFTRPPNEGGENTRSYRFRGTEYTLRYLPTDRNTEATLYEGDTMVGKYFLTRTPSTPLGIEKFRVPCEGNVVLSFVNVRQ